MKCSGIKSTGEEVSKIKREMDEDRKGEFGRFYKKEGKNRKKSRIE